MIFTKKVRDIVHKTSFKNGVWMYLLQFFNAIVPMLTIPYITRILGAAQYGVFSMALNIVTYLQVVVEYGFGMSATRKVALFERENIDRLFTAVLFSRIFLLILCAVFSGIYVFIRISNIRFCLSLSVLLICLLGYCVQVNWLFQGKQEMKYISLINIFARVISVIGIFCFVKGSEDLLLYCLLYSVSPFLSGFIGMMIAWKKYNLKIVRISVCEIGRELKDGWYVFTTQLSSKVFSAIGITFLGLFATETEVGVFSAIQKIPNIIMLGWTPIAQVLYPISSKRLKEDWGKGTNFVYSIRKIIIIIFLLIATLVSIFSKLGILILFGEEYVSHFYWAIPLLYWIVIAINNNFMGVQILLGSCHDKEYSKCFQIGVICTVITNLILIYLWRGNGASIAPLLSETILGFLLAHEIRKIDSANGHD